MPRRSSSVSLISAMLVLQGGCVLNNSRQLNAGDIRGRAIFGAAGTNPTPAAGAVVTLEDSVISVAAGSDGTFVIPNLPDGTYVVDITAAMPGSGAPNAGWRSKPVTLDTNSGSNGQDLSQISLQALGTVTGTLSGLPAAGATDGGVIPPPTVVLSGVTQTSANGAVLTTFGESNVQTSGAFTFANVLPNDPASPYQVAAFAETAAQSAIVGNAATVSVSAGSTQTVSVSLTGGMQASSAGSSGSISGVAQFLNTSGTMDNSGINITIESPDVDSSTLDLVNCSALPPTTDSQGDYNVSSLSPGVYTVTASSGGSSSVTLTGVFVGAGTTTLPSITLENGGNDAGVGTGTDSERIQAGCQNLDTWNGNYFPTVATCEQVVGNVVSQLEATTGCASIAQDLLSVADCAGIAPGTSEPATCSQLTTSPLPTDICFAAFYSLYMDTTQSNPCSPCSVIAGPIVYSPTDGGTPVCTDGGPVDGGPTDAGPGDAGPADAGATDAGTTDAG